MGDSSAEIDQQIKETRQHLEANLGVLESRAVSGARRVARIGALVGIALAATAGVVLVVYAVRRRRSVAARLRDVVPGSIRDLPRGLPKKLEKRLAAVSVATAISSRILRPPQRTTPGPSE
jgi:hypothetical protein